MQHFFVKQEQIKENMIEIIGKDVNHIKNVLRCKIKEKIEISNIEKEEKYLVEIVEIIDDKVRCNILEKINEIAESNVKINIIQGLPKSDKMELIIQKCTELGVIEITPLELERCVVKLDGKDADKKITRWQTIAETAAKQCCRNVIPKINRLYNLKNIEEKLKNIDLAIVAYEDEKELDLRTVLNEVKFKNLQNELAYGAANNFENINKTLKNEVKDFNIAVIIGPEGGLKEEEVVALKNMGVKSISLGKRILRTETVAMVLSGIIMYELGDLGTTGDT